VAAPEQLGEEPLPSALTLSKDPNRTTATMLSRRCLIQYGRERDEERSGRSNYAP
jgi:hypothetical protein